jgi:hypothetical protein
MFVLAKLKERDEARRLRAEQGLPMKQIAALLGVSPASVHLWTADIAITAEQRERNLTRARGLSGEVWRKKSRDRRLAYQQEGRRRAREGDPLHQAGCMLFWAEGSKARNAVILANSDPNLLRYFARFLRTCVEVPPEQLRVCLNVYLGNGLSIREIEDHWLEILELPRTCLGSTSSTTCLPPAVGASGASCLTECVGWLSAVLASCNTSTARSRSTAGSKSPAGWTRTASVAQLRLSVRSTRL